MIYTLVSEAKPLQKRGNTLDILARFFYRSRNIENDSPEQKNQAKIE